MKIETNAKKKVKMSNRPAALFLAAFVAAWTVPAHGGDTAPGIGTDMLRPVTTIGREDIVFSGQHTLLELLDLHSGTNFFGLGRPFVAGAGRMVLLIDGRLAGPLQDRDTIPLSMVERVEILDGNAVGALAGYAVAGAVNVVLRKDVEGFEAQGLFSQPAEEGARSQSGSVLWAGPVGKGRMMLGVDSFRRGEIRPADRDYARASWREGGSFSGTVGVSPSGNTVIVNRDGLRPSKADETRSFRSYGNCRTEDGYTGALGNPFGSKGADDTGCGFATAARDWYTYRYNQTGVFAALTHPVGGGAEIFSEVRAMPESRGILRKAPASGQFAFTPSNPADFGGDDDDLFRVAHTFVAHGDRKLRGDRREYRLSLGLRGRAAAGFGYETQVILYRDEYDRTAGPFVSKSAMLSAVASSAYNLANPLSSPQDIVRSTALRLDREYRADYREFSVALNGAGLRLGGGKAKWKAGAELATDKRRNRLDYRDRAGVSYRIADVLGAISASDTVEYNGERRRASAFAEVSLPFGSGWDATLAVRGDDYDDVGGALSWRVATRYRLTDAVALRASLGAGARPPDFAALRREPSGSVAWVCDSRNHGSSTAPCKLHEVTHDVAGNPALDPELSRSASVGASLKFGRMSFSADWFRIKLSRMPLATGSAQAIMKLEAAGALPPGASVTRNRSGDPVAVGSTYGNTGKEEISGFDVSLEGAWPTDWADIELKLHWLRRTDYKAWNAGVRLPGHVPRDSAHALLRARWGDIAAHWSVHGRSGYANARETGRFGSWIGHDLVLDVRKPFGLTGARLTAGVINIGDEEPSVDSANPNALAIDLDSLRGRTFFLSLKATF